MLKGLRAFRNAISTIRTNLLLVPTVPLFRIGIPSASVFRAARSSGRRDRTADLFLSSKHLPPAWTFPLKYDYNSYGTARYSFNRRTQTDTNLDVSVYLFGWELLSNVLVTYRYPPRTLLVNTGITGITGQ